VPLITYEEACAKMGLTVAQCAARRTLDAGRWHDVNLACMSAFPGDTRHFNTCYQLCGYSSRDVAACASEIRLDASEDLKNTALTAHWLAGISWVATMLAIVIFRRVRRA
jgi:hypothetical protein